MRTISRCLILCLLLISGFTQAASRIELIELQHRTATDVIPLVQPLLQEGESVTGTGFQLILKAEPERLQEIAALIAKLDSRINQLRISVRQGQQQTLDRSQTGVTGQIRIDDSDASVSGRARILSTQGRSDDSGTYQVTALEGTPVFIAQGLRFPVTTTQTQIVSGRVIVIPETNYETVSSGFYAKAWLQKPDRVMLELAPQREALVSSRYGTVSHSSISTRLQGRLNEWLPVGGSTQSIDGDGSGLTHQYSTLGRDDEQVWLKVEIIE